MHAFDISVFEGRFNGKAPKTATEFKAKNPHFEKFDVISIKRPRFKVGDRVLIKIGRVAVHHNTGYTTEDGYAHIKAVDVIDDGISAKGVCTRVIYQIEFETPCPWINIESNWLATNVVVQESSLMVHA